jgi:hypothetical protein
VRVADGEATLIRPDVLQGLVGRLVLLIVKHGVSLRKGTSLDILSGNSNVSAFQQQGSESQRLGCGPVNVLSLLDRLATGVQDTSQVSVRGETFRGVRYDLADVLEDVLLDTSRVMRQDVLRQLLGSWETVPRGREPLLGRRLVPLTSIESLLQHTPDPVLVLGDLLLGKALLLDQLLAVDIERSRLFLDGLVHPGLGERRLVGLVVTVSSVTDDIDDNVLLELGPEIGSHGTDKVDGLDVVSVDVEDGRVDGLCDIRTVRRRSRESRVGSETDLVVDDQVERTTDSIVGQVVHSHGFVDDTLTGKGGVSVEQYPESGVVVLLVTLEVLDSPGLSHDDRVFSLQVGRVGNQREGDLLPGRRRSDIVGTQVVLDVSTTRVVRISVARELVQDGLDGLPDDVSEHVQSTTMGHTHDDALDTSVDRSVDQGLHTRDQGLATLETESLLVGVLRSDELFEKLGPHQPVEDDSLFFGVVLPLVGLFDPFPNPVTLVLLRDVNVLHTDRSSCSRGASFDVSLRSSHCLHKRSPSRLTVHLLQALNDLSQSHLLDPSLQEPRQDPRSEVELFGQVLFRPPVMLEVELGHSAAIEVGIEDSERVELGNVVSSDLVSTDEELDLGVREIGETRVE